MSQPIPPNAADWNNFFSLAFYIALAALSVVVVAMVYFIIRYRERKGQLIFVPEKRLSKSRARDAVVFAVISIVILFSVTVAGDRLTLNARFQPSVSQSLVIDVTAFQWGFMFHYPNNVTSGDLYVPSNTTLMFNVTSTDVMHNFGLMDFKVKIDGIPGRYNVIWVTTPPLNGQSEIDYTVRCYELCGSGHTFMVAPMKVIAPTAFSQWLSNQAITANSTIPGG